MFDDDGLAATALFTDQHAVFDEVAVLAQRRVGLCDEVVQLVVGGQVIDLTGDLAVDDLAVRGFDEAEGVDAAVGGQRTDQADVRAFRGLDRAHASVVGRVDVSDFHACTVTGQAARAQRGKTTLVRQTGQRVVLVHELRELGGSEELLDCRNNRADVDQRLRGDCLDVLGGHAFANHALHAGQTRANLVLDQFAHGADATVAEVVDVIDAHGQIDGLAVADARGGLLAGVQRDEELDHRDNVVDVQDRGVGAVQRGVDTELAVDLVTANLGQVVALRLEVEVLQQRLCGIDRRRLARAKLAVDIQECFFLGIGGVLLQGGSDRVVLPELFQDPAFGPAKGLEQDGDRLLALAVEADADLVALVDFEFEPGTARRDDLRGEDVLVTGLVRGALEVGARGTHQLGHHDTLGAVDDEGALVGHQREVAHEHGLLLDFARVVVHELGLDVQRSRVGCVAVLALGHRVLRISELRLREAQGHGLLEVFNRGDLFENLGQA